MVQGSILQQNRSGRILHGGDATARVNRSVLHAQTSAVQIRHGINSRGARAEDFRFGCRAFSSVRSQQFVEVLLSILAGEDDVARLLVKHPVLIRIICIQLHGRIRRDINRIPEFDTLPFCSRQRNHIIATSGIDAAQAIITIYNLGISLKQNRSIMADIQVACGINSSTVRILTTIVTCKNNCIAAESNTAIAKHIDAISGIHCPPAHICKIIDVSYGPSRISDKFNSSVFNQINFSTADSPAAYIIAIP